LALAAVKTEAQKALGAQRDRQDHEQSTTAWGGALAELKTLSAQISLLEQRGISLYEDFAEGKLDRDEYLTTKSVCVEEIFKIQIRVDELSRILDTVSIQEKSFPVGEPLLRRVIEADELTSEVLALIDRIVVYDAERIEIWFAFRDSNVFKS